MESKHELTGGSHDPQRRELMRAAGMATVAGLAGLSAGLPSMAQAAPADGRGVLGARLQGVQHVGITVQNMDRAFEFYTQVLGGTEIMRDGDFQGEVIHNTLLLTEELKARERQVNPRTLGIPDLRGGAQRLDVRFIQFDNVVIELLQYRDSSQPQGSGASFAPPHANTSPAFPTSMHVCFYIRDDVDFNQFVRDLEAEAAKRGMANVKANRIISSASEKERLSAPLNSMTNRITSGKSDGWTLMYAKGPEGEQLEFVQVRGQARKVFGRAEALRRQAG
ncbi:VOC family protein [Massilia niastensis]|uniref:VOC family protein n=1 Tax=Massilia niastensis TaxID=544911 RepID=UPI0005932875|nr:VOC family protein [Massilia niastensis]